MSLIYRAPTPPSDVPTARRAHGLYLGGKVDAKSRSKLGRLGITHILNVTPALEAGIQAGVPNYHEHSSAFPRIVYKRIPVYDLPSSDLLSHADSIVGFVSLGLHHGSVLVHCREGVSRSTTAVAFFLIRRLRMTCEEALALCRERKADVQPIPAFSAQLDKYEAKCRRMGIIGKSRKRPKLVMGESTVPAETGKKEKKARVVGPAHATCSSIIGPSPKPLLARPSIAPPPMADQVCAKSNIGALLDSTTSKRTRK